MTRHRVFGRDRYFFVLGAGLATALHAAEMAQVAREHFGPEAVAGEKELVDEVVALCAAGLRARLSHVPETATGVRQRAARGDRFRPRRRAGARAQEGK